MRPAARRSSSTTTASRWDRPEGASRSTSSRTLRSTAPGPLPSRVGVGGRTASGGRTTTSRDSHSPSASAYERRPYTRRTSPLLFP